MAVDILKIKSAGEMAETGKDIKIKAPDGSDSFTVTVRGSNSDAYQKHFKKVFRDEQRKALAQKRKPKDDEPIELDEAFEKLVDDCIVRVVKWDGLMNGAKPLECTPDNIKLVIGLYGKNNFANEFISRVAEASEELGKI